MRLTPRVAWLRPSLGLQLYRGRWQGACQVNDQAILAWFDVHPLILAMVVGSACIVWIVKAGK